MSGDFEVIEARALPPMFDLRQEVVVHLLGGIQRRGVIVGRTYTFGGMRYVVDLESGERVPDIGAAWLCPVARPSLRIVR